MKIFLDTANVNQIREFAFIIDGVTTNPSLIAKEGRDFKEVVTEICSIVDGPISAEVVSEKAEDMVKEAEDLVKIHKNITIKIPMNVEGLKCTKELTKLGIKTNVTLVFSPNQALLAAKAGATYVSPFVGRIDDLIRTKIGGDFEKTGYFPAEGIEDKDDGYGTVSGVDLIKKTVKIFKKYNLKTEIIAASLRNPRQVAEIAKTGVDIATIPYNVLKEMFKHIKTDEGIKAFLKDWETTKK